MSICAAVCDPTNDSVVIATDSLAVWGDFHKDLGPKFIEYYAYGVTVAYAGSTRFAQIAERLMRDNKYFRTAFNMRTIKRLATDLQKATKEEGQEALGDSQLLLVCKGHKRIHEIDTDFAVHKHKRWASIGSGGTFCEVVLEALFDLNVDITVKERLMSAMKSVCAHHTECGGKIHIREV